jgi:DNA replication protein DnaD
MFNSHVQRSLRTTSPQAKRKSSLFFVAREIFFGHKEAMKLADYRAEMGMTLAEMCADIERITGVRFSITHLYEIESGGLCALDKAVALERYSNGLVKPLDLVQAHEERERQKKREAKKQKARG